MVTLLDQKRVAFELFQPNAQLIKTLTKRVRRQVRSKCKNLRTCDLSLSRASSEDEHLHTARSKWAAPLEARNVDYLSTIGSAIDASSLAQLRRTGSEATYEGRQMNNGSHPDLGYPTPLPPMIGGYMARKRYVAAGLGVIDGACRAVSWVQRSSNSAASTGISSILVSQCGHLGDLIMTLPMLHWIRSNKPHIKIGLLVGSWAMPMMKGLAELYDAYYVADHFMLDRSDRTLREKLSHHRKSWKTAATEIMRDNYDAAIECFPFLPNSIPLLYACNIPRRVGFTSGGFGPLLSHKVSWIHESRPVLDYYRDLLRMLFAEDSLSTPLRPFYPVPTGLDTFSELPYVLVQTGTGNAIKEWPENCWIQLVRELRQKDATVILAGAGARERERAARIRGAVQGVNDLCDRLSWNQFTALVARAAHVVCLDSSTSHLAAALQIPCTVIASGITDLGQYGPASEQARVFTYPTPCAPCFRSNGCEHMACVRGVGVDEVIQSVTTRLAS